MGLSWRGADGGQGRASAADIRGPQSHPGWRRSQETTTPVSGCRGGRFRQHASSGDELRRGSAV